MSESENAESITTEDAETGKEAKAERKRVRHRKKQLYERILRQMEFYFSDANLTKDRYLGQLTRTEPAVPLDIFLRFNKIRALTQDVRDIAKALRNSQQLVCTDDEKKVQRVTPLRAYDAEQRTVYVESVPVTASRDWLEGVFREYGHVAYISLPKFRNSQRIKGFAFVEFDKPEDAQKCLAAFTKMGCKLPTCMPPEELSTIRMFSVENAPDEKTAEESPTDETKAVTESSSRDKKKRQGGKEVGEEPPRKKQKKQKKGRKSEEAKSAEEADGVHAIFVRQKWREEAKSLDTSMEDADKAGTDKDARPETGASSQDEPGGKPDDKKKKSRKRTAKERNKSRLAAGKKEAPKGAQCSLQVLSKLEWKVLRNQYLNLQRKKMKELKKTLRMQSLHRPPLQLKPAKNIHAEAAGKAVVPVKPIERVEGVFVKVELSEPCLDVRQTKRQVRSNIHVQHVDVKEGQTEMIVRFQAPDSAAQYCSSGIYATARVLVGSESEEQWERVAAEREAGGAERRPRGRTRLLQRAAAATAATAPSGAALLPRLEPLSTLPTLPTLPALPALPALPTLPTLPTIPILPTTGSNHIRFDE